MKKLLFLILFIIPSSAFADPSNYSIPTPKYLSATSTDSWDEDGIACSGTALYRYTFLTDESDYDYFSSQSNTPLISESVSFNDIVSDVSLNTLHTYNYVIAYTTADEGNQDLVSVQNTSSFCGSFSSPTFTVEDDPIVIPPDGFYLTATSSASSTVYVSNLDNISFSLAWIIFFLSFFATGFIYAQFLKPIKY